MPVPRYGYCCRPKLKGYVERECFGSVRLWFSLKADAVDNADSSNPQRIYDLLQRIVEQDDHGHRYLRDLRRELADTVRLSNRPLNIRHRLRRQIEEASMDCFQPERLRLDLSWIAKQRGGTVAGLLDACRRRARAAIVPPQWLQADEYLVDGLSFADLAAWCRFL